MATEGHGSTKRDKALKGKRLGKRPEAFNVTLNDGLGTSGMATGGHIIS